VILPVASLLVPSSRRLSAALLVPPVLTLAIVTQNKNPYYVFVVLPSLAVLAACSVEAFSPVARRIVVALVLAIVAVSASVFAWRGIEFHGPTTADATETLARSLPPDATVLAANVYAGLIQRRPDIQFFNYHALSLRPGWALPACATMPRTIEGLVAGDPRVTSRHDARFAYAIAPSEPGFTDYLRLIYPKGTPADAACLADGERGSRRQLRVCREDRTPCETLTMTPIALGEHYRPAPAH
jgi:hypothetical protein